MLDEDDPPVKDVIAAGFETLVDSSGNPLVKFNHSFTRLKARHRLNPIVPSSESTQTLHTSASHDPPSNPSPTCIYDNPVLLEAISTDITNTVAMADEDDDNDDGDHESDMCGSFECGVDEPDEHDEPTLTRENADDVSLDMDAEDLACYVVKENEESSQTMEEWECESTDSGGHTERSSESGLDDDIVAGWNKSVD